MELFSLLSSLPYLKLYETPYYTFAEFLELCSMRISGVQMALLEQLSILPGCKKNGNITGKDYDAEYADFQNRIRKSLPERALIRKYAEWEMALRNSLAKIRASKWNRTENSLRENIAYEADTERIAQAAYSAANPLERERILDEARWDKLDELTRINHCHSFTFDAVCAYGLKLQLAEKWVRRSGEAAMANLNKAAELVQQPSVQQ